MEKHISSSCEIERIFGWVIRLKPHPVFYWVSLILQRGGLKLVEFNKLVIFPYWIQQIQPIFLLNSTNSTRFLQKKGMVFNFFKTWLLLIFKIFLSDREFGPMVHLEKKLEILKALFSWELTSKKKSVELVEFNKL